MSDKLKMAHADRITDARRDAVLAAADDFSKVIKSASYDRRYVIHSARALRSAVESYEALAESVDCSCPAPDVCKRHGHCFKSDNDARGDD